MGILNRLFPLKNTRPRSRKSTTVASSSPFLWKGLWIHWKTRPYYRNFNVRVNPDGKVIATTGKQLKKEHLDTMLVEYESWIRKQLVTFKKLMSDNAVPELKPGSYLPFKGQGFLVCWEEKDLAKLKCEIDERSQEVRLYGKQWDVEEVHQVVLKAYSKRARKHLEQRTLYYSERMQLFPNKISYRAQNSRWGSCSSEGNLSLNWKLIAAPLDKVDYVIVHELSHLVHMNHSKKFWDLVSTEIPDYRERQMWLQQNQLRFEFLKKDSMFYSRYSNFSSL